MGQRQIAFRAEAIVPGVTTMGAKQIVASVSRNRLGIKPRSRAACELRFRFRNLSKRLLQWVLLPSHPFEVEANKSRSSVKRSEPDSLMINTTTAMDNA